MAEGKLTLYNPTDMVVVPCSICQSPIDWREDFVRAATVFHCYKCGWKYAISENQLRYAYDVKSCIERMLAEVKRAHDREAEEKKARDLYVYDKYLAVFDPIDGGYPPEPTESERQWWYLYTGRKASEML
jgi:transcription elongation factor Elf1